MKRRLRRCVFSVSDVRCVENTAPPYIFSRLTHIILLLEFYPHCRRATDRMAMIAYVMSKRLLPLIAFRIVRLSLCYGICRESAFGVAIYSLILAGYLGDATGASRFGKLALKLVDKFNTHERTARIYFVLYGFVFIWTEPIQACIQQNFQASEIG